MSKIDALRAMREARYAEAVARAAQPAAPRPVPTKPASAEPAAERTPRAVRTPASDPAPSAAEADETLCGHRNMGGRTCTREKGHTAKSHRYG